MCSAVTLKIDNSNVQWIECVNKININVLVTLNVFKEIQYTVNDFA